MAVFLLFFLNTFSHFLSSHQDLRKAYLKELAKGDVIQPIRAVEDNTLLGDGFSQIFGGFGLSCPSRTLRSASQVKMQSPKQSSGGRGQISTVY